MRKLSLISSSGRRTALPRAGLALAVTVLSLFSLAAPGQSTNAPRRLDYSDFKLIPDRNIFNTRRYARSAGASERRDSRRVSRVEAFTLVGTMNYEKGPLAFFDSSRSDYRKAAQPGDSIGEFKVTDIDLNQVRLVAGTNNIELAVGKQMRREDEGNWFATTPPETSGGSYASPSRPRPVSNSSVTQAASAPSPTFEGEGPMVVLDAGQGPMIIPMPGDSPAEGVMTNVAPAVAPDGPESDVLRRLMQRREEEMNR
jgi:hypothetical protein